VSDPEPDALATRSLAWRRASLAAVCDLVQPWAHGTVARATRYPSYFDFNVVVVEDDPGMSVDGLVAVADRALAGLAHRRIDFELVGAAEPLRAGFEARRWNTSRLLWMHHVTPPPPGPTVAVEEVDYDAVTDLRAAWHQEDFPGQDFARYYAQAREATLRRDVHVLALREAGIPVAFAQLERDGPAAEITQVYVHPQHRGRGRGTALTRAAIEAAADARDLWIVADDEGRPKKLYARLGFRPVRTTMDFTRWPDAPGPR
jgi:ribosomal protein S18 acetylase RimI-like enzyme